MALRKTAGWQIDLFKFKLLLNLRRIDADRIYSAGSKHPV